MKKGCFHLRPTHGHATGTQTPFVFLFYQIKSPLGITLANGKVWEEQRKFAHSVFRSLGVGKKSYEDTVAAEMDQLRAAIEEKDGSPFDPNLLFGQAIANIVCSVAFGTQYKYSDVEFRQVNCFSFRFARGERGPLRVTSFQGTKRTSRRTVGQGGTKVRQN